MRRREIPPGRRRDVDEHLSAVEREQLWHRQVPEVLADRQPDAGADPRRHRAEHVARGEEAPLIEQPVRGQVHLPMDVADLAVLDERGRNEEPVVARFLDEGDDRRETPRGAGEPGESRVVESHRDVGGEVLEQVAREAQLGEDDQAGARLARAIQQCVVDREVLVEQAEPGRDLRERDPEGRHRASIPSRSGPTALRPGARGASSGVNALPLASVRTGDGRSRTVLGFPALARPLRP